MPHWLNLLVATALAGIGGELFVRGVVGVAARWGLSELLVAMTVAACATSAPELTVSILASANGNSALAMGDSLGSNVTNLLLILGISLLFGPLNAKIAALRSHLYWVVGAPLFAAFLLREGILSRVEGALLLMAFLAWLGLTVAGIRRGKPAVAPEAPAAGLPLAALLVLLTAGVAILALAGDLFVKGGRGVAQLFDLPDAVVGATVVALGTSTPELMTTLVARWRGHHDVGLGTLLGSNLFNGLAILGTAALIAPVHAPVLPAWLMLFFGVVGVLLVVPRQERLGRRRGVLMLACYALYVAALGFGDLARLGNSARVRDGDVVDQQCDAHVLKVAEHLDAASDRGANDERASVPYVARPWLPRYSVISTIH